MEVQVGQKYRKDSTGEVIRISRVNPDKDDCHAYIREGNIAEEVGDRWTSTVALREEYTLITDTPALPEHTALLLAIAEARKAELLATLAAVERSIAQLKGNNHE